MDRRSFLKASVLAAAGAAVDAQPASAVGPIVGTVIDYSGGVPSAGSVKAAGHLGAVRYVSERRPGADWMVGKPVGRAETADFAAHGLGVASVYQFGRAETADWLSGAAGAVQHAPKAIALHAAAGGPKGRPIYVAIDDNPTWDQFAGQIRPYLQGFKQALEAAGLRLGVYGNYNVIEWAGNDGLGEFFWMHDWGSGGRIHPRTTIHQPAKRTATIDGVTVDVNNVYSRDWGQWNTTSSAPLIPGLDRLLNDTSLSSRFINMDAPITIPGVQLPFALPTPREILQILQRGAALSS